MLIEHKEEKEGGITMKKTTVSVTSLFLAVLLLTVLISCGQSTDTPAQVTTSMSVEAETA